MASRTFEVYRETRADSTPGQWRWRLRAKNHQIVAVSGEDFDSRANALRAARREAALFRDPAPVTVLT